MNPLHERIFAPLPMHYYWSAYQTEWATDIMFRNPRTLAELYPPLVRHAMEHFKSPDVMRFSQKSNNAYLDALSTVDDSTPCSRLFDAVAKPTSYNQQRVRALRLADPHDLALLQAVSRGEFATAGFRNRDIRALILPTPVNSDPADLRRASAKISRQLRILRAHGLVAKIPNSHRYRLTHKGQLLTAALFATRRASIKQLLAAA